MSKRGYEARVRAWGQETADRFEYGIRPVAKIAAAPIRQTAAAPIRIGGAPKRRRRRRNPVRDVTRATRSIGGFARLLAHGRR